MGNVRCYRDTTALTFKAFAPDSEFVGACLQANHAGKQSSPQATIRRQASSYKGTRSPRRRMVLNLNL